MRSKSLLFFLIISFNSFAQGETWNWYIGNNDGIKFVNGKNLKLVYYKPVEHWESNSSLSDSLGKLLLFSSGKRIIDKNGKIIIDSLKSHTSSSQGNLFLKHPKSGFIYFFYTSASEGIQYGTKYSVISNLKDSFFMKEIDKPVYPNTAEKMNAVNHQNNNDIWIINHSENADTFYLFLLKKTGLICCPFKNKTGIIYTGDGLEGSAQIKFSPSGKKILNTTWFKSKTELFNFDNEKGKMDLKVTIPSLFSVSTEFSSDESIFYINENTTRIVQYKIDIKYNYKSKIIKESDYEFYYIQSGFDKKIYISKIGNFLTAITNPDSIGLKCNYNDSFLKLTKLKDTPGLPNFNASYFYTPSIDYSYEQDCRTNSISFEGKDTIQASSFKWIFTKGNKTDTKNSKNTSYTFADTGKWEVSYIAGNGSRSDTVTKNITIHPKLEQGFLGADKPFCSILPTLQSPQGLHCIHWYNDTMAELSKVPTFTPSKAGTYFAKATNLSFCVEWDTIEVFKTAPQADFLVNDICQTDTVFFNNKSKNAANFFWKFGDGDSSNMFNPNHFYKINNSTTYNVTLVAVTDLCRDSATKAVTVNKNPDSDFTFTLNGSNIELNAKTGGINYEWKFGNTDSFSSGNPIYSRNINLQTQKNICLKVTNLAGCKTQTCKDVTLGVTPFLKESDIKIYPNPSNGKINIEIYKAGVYNLKVFNYLGQLSIEKNIINHKNETIDFSANKGFYIIEIKNNYGAFFYEKVLVD